jgi:hypothetical protein
MGTGEIKLKFYSDYLNGREHSEDKRHRSEANIKNDILKK